MSRVYCGVGHGVNEAQRGLVLGVIVYSSSVSFHRVIRCGIHTYLTNFFSASCGVRGTIDLDHLTRVLASAGISILFLSVVINGRGSVG